VCAEGLREESKEKGQRRSLGEEGRREDDVPSCVASWIVLYYSPVVVCLRSGDLH